MTRVFALGCLLLAGVAAAQDGVPTLRLRSSVVVRAAQVRWMDLVDGPVDAELGRQIVVASPAPGHERSWTRAQLLREIVRRGASVVPRLDGSPSVTIERPGNEVAPDRLARLVRSDLESLPPPGRALAHRYEILRIPRVTSSSGAIEVGLEDPGPRIGRGAVTLSIHDGGPSPRRVFAMVRRSARVLVLRARQALPARSVIDFTVARIDTVWTDDLRILDEALDVDDAEGSWTLLRSVRGDRVLARGDVRATPVVRRGESVRWIVDRQGLHVEVRARARNDGAVGEWITIESPFDRRLRRVVVTAPGRVADHLPETEKTTASALDKGVLQ